MPYTKLPESEGCVLCYKSEGEVRPEDYKEKLIPAVEAAKGEYGKVRILFDIRGVSISDFPIATMMEDMKFFINQVTCVERVAIVGDHKWEAMIISATNAFTPHCVLHFFHAELDENRTIPVEALHWVFAGTGLAPGGRFKISNKDVEEHKIVNPWKEGSTSWLLCMDASPEARLAFQHTMNLIRNKTDHLHILSIYGEKDEQQMKDLQNNAKAEAEGILSSEGSPFIVTLHTMYMPYSHKYPGSPIVDIANRHNIDYIVMGSRGHGTLKKFVLGSASQYVVEHANCPVILVKTPPPKEHHN